MCFITLSSIFSRFSYKTLSVEPNFQELNIIDLFILLKLNILVNVKRFTLQSCGEIYTTKENLPDQKL